MIARSPKLEVGNWKTLGSRRAMVRQGLALRSVVVTAFFALSQAVLASAPATAPAVLPAGHPVIEATTLPSAGSATLPAGHPAMGTISPTDGAASTTLPAGHPPMGLNLAAPPSSVLTTQNANLKGTLNISVIGASANGLTTANEGVTVELYNQGTPVKRTEYKTDGLGKVQVADIPLMPPLDIVVSIHHAGLLQQAEAPPLTLEVPVQSVEMKVFDPTDVQPAWTVAMQHMIVDWAKDGSGAVVTEMISTSNPGDRAWTGTKVAGTGGLEKHVTLTLPLPPGADKVELGGSFDEDDSRIVEGKLVTGSPLFPGRSEFRLTYTVPAKNGAVELPIVAPAAVGKLIVFVPADETQVTATGISGGKAMDMGQGSGAVRMYSAENLAAGAMANLSITGIKAAPAAADDGAAAAGGGSQMSPRNLAVGGAFLLVLAGAALMLMKKPQAKKE